MSKDPWIDPARATFLYTVVKRAVDKRRSAQGRGKEGPDASPDAPTRSGDGPAHPQRGDSLIAWTYLFGMWLNVTLAAFHLPGHFPQVPGLYDWVIPGWFLAVIGIFVVFLLLSGLSGVAGLKTYGFAGLTIVAVLLVGGIEGVLPGMGLIFLVSLWISATNTPRQRRR